MAVKVSVHTYLRSVPIGAQFKVGDNQRIFVRIPEMILHLPTVNFVVNCVYEKSKGEHSESDMICDFFTPETPCEYWWPEINV
jgi:hypothetical protein